MKKYRLYKIDKILKILFFYLLYCTSTGGRKYSDHPSANSQSTLKGTVRGLVGFSLLSAFSQRL